MKKVNAAGGEQRRKNLFRGMAIMSIVGLILQMSMASIFKSSLVSLTAKVSIASEVQGTCNWGEWQLVGESNYWQTRVSSEVTKTWCDSKSIEFHPAVFTPNPTPIPTPTPDISPTPTLTPSEDLTPTPETSPDPTVSPTPTPSVDPTPTPTISPDSSVTPTPTPTPTVTPTPAPIITSSDGGGGVVLSELSITNESKTISKEGL